jgi:ribosomal protein S18 acetylase RimI-like enzyme
MRRMSIAAISWLQTEALRSSVLGWEPAPVPGDEDASAVHLGEVNVSGRVTAVVSFAVHPCPDRPGVIAMYLWAMAVAPELQQLGAGRRLLVEVMSRARAANAEVVWADAREEAVGFYERCGAIAVGDPYSDDVTGLPDRRILFEQAPPVASP